MESSTFAFPSLEWAQELANRLNARTDYRDSSENWKGTLVMSIMAEPGQLASDVNIALDPTGGTIKDVHLTDEAGKKQATFTLLGKYPVWKDILAGKYDILTAVMMGKIKLRGHLFRLMLQLKTPEIILKEMRGMPSRFADAESAH
ncbi:SCP2 sterol-binding domain-containing protein [Pendulispora albinea]|uniref:SCP2 sterol-binding domain-containing protein n=1 Tax=Pendulispora albinea TaxID=2741071 RepID=A0ABZ2MBS7_9BACT